MATSKPKYLPGQDPTVHAGEAITGSRFLKLNPAVSQHADGHAQVLMSDAGEISVGVSAFDAASGTKLLLFCEGVVEVEAGEAIGHGDLIMSGANGVAMIATEGNPVCGQAWADAANGAQCLVKLGAPLGLHLQAVDAVV